jgi:glycosyltransferase involved in cell wall biosynthesis
MLSGIDPIYPTPIGAIEPYVTGLSNELSLCHSLDVFGYGKGSMQRNNLHIDTFPFESSHFNYLKHLVGDEYAHGLLYNSYVLEKILKIQKKNPFDILHMHMIYTALVASFTKYTFNIPVVCSIHNEVRTALPLNICDKILANSQFIRSSLIKIGVRQKKIEVVPIAIDTEKFKPKKSQQQIKHEIGLTNSRIILFVGRKVHHKGPQILISALPAIIRQNPEVIAVFIGPDYSFSNSSLSYTVCLQKLARKLGVENKVIFKKFMADGELLKFFNSADVVVFPSTWQEPFGKVILEAMSFEKPIVASNVGGIPEIIESGVNGLLVPSGDSVALADEINYVLDHEEFAAELGRKGRQTVLDNYTFQIAAKKCNEIYQKLI